MGGEPELGVDRGVSRGGCKTREQRNSAPDMESRGFFGLGTYWPKCQQYLLPEGIWTGIMKEGTQWGRV